MAPPPRSSYGAAFVALLAELGYDRGDLSAEMFDALFALPSMRVQAFLEWFLASVTPRQSVLRQLGSAGGASDYALYTALLDGSLTEQHGLLTGDELVVQERLCQVDAQRDESLDALLAQNAGLEHEIAQLEAQVQRINAKNDKIAAIVQRKAQQVEAHARSGGFQSDFGVERRHFSELISAQIDSIIGHLAVDQTDDSPPSSSMLFGRHHSERSAAAQPKAFLFQQSIAPLQEMELRNLEELKSKVASIVLSSNTSDSHALALTAEKRARNGHSQAVVSGVNRDQERQQQQQPSWLHNSDPSSLQLHEQDALIYNKCSLELARLEKAYATGEQDALLARMQLAKNASLWRQMSESRHILSQQYQLMSPSTVNAKRQALLETMRAMTRELTQFVHHVLPKAFDEMAFLRTATILLGSYEQKLWRQEHRFLELRALLDAFDHQHGRLKLVHRVLDAEWEDLVDADAMLGAIFKDVEFESAQILARLKSQPTGAHATSNGGTEAGHPRSSIPDAEQIAHALYDYLQHSLQSRQQQHNSIDTFHTEGGARRHSFRLRTFEELVRLCDETSAEQARVAESLDHVDHEWLQLYESKRQNFLALRNELFGDSTSSTPMLMPPNLVALLREAAEAKEHTEQELHTTLESLRLKKRELAMDPTRRQQQTDSFERLKQQLAAKNSEMEH